MLSKSDIKLISALRQKKNRDKEGLFIAEGEKLVFHLCALLGQPQHAFATKPDLLNGANWIAEADMRKLTSLKTISPVLAVFKKPKFEIPLFSEAATLVLDGLRDPGNMGTILRLCDWFGINQVVCTPDCVDVFNEKVVQASMGSVATVDVQEAAIHQIIAAAQAQKVSLIGADLQGKNAYSYIWPKKFGLIIGNEGQGISNALKAALQEHISIPASCSAKAESLNAAMATAVLLSQYHSGSK